MSARPCDAKPKWPLKYIVDEDRSLLELLDADYVFVNSELAELYGIPNVHGKEMQRVTLPAAARAVAY